jgi:hypothetical protein
MGFSGLHGRYGISHQSFSVILPLNVEVGPRYHFHRCRLMFMAVKPVRSDCHPACMIAGLVLATESCRCLPLLKGSITAQRENCPANGDGEAVRCGNSDAVRLQEKEK